jgi:hypothetical protein
MLQKQFLFAFLITALVTMACGISFNLPEAQVKTGPTIVDEISIPASDSDAAVKLSLEFGAGELKLGAGSADTILEGTATYNVEDFKSKIIEDGQDIAIEQGNLQVTGIPNFTDDVVNEWDFNLGSQLLELKIQAGAYSGKFELGGLSIKRLEISDGAADVHLSFSEPNLVEMDVLEYTTGASNVTLEGLSNANINTMTFRSGAGSYRLDFSGELQQDAEVHIESGISSVVIVVPEGVHAKVTFEGGMANVSYYGEWTRDGNQYIQAGEGPVIEIVVKMGAGNLELRNR